MRETEQTFDLTLPIVQGWLDGGKSLVSPESFEAALNGPDDAPIILEFLLDDAAFLLDRPVRLKGIGLSFGSKFGLVHASGIDSIQTADNFVRLAASISTPPQLYPNGVSFMRHPIVIGNVALHQNGPPPMSVGVGVENINPYGKWKIRIHPWMVWKDGGTYSVRKGIRDERIRDLKIHLQFYAPSVNEAHS